MALNKHREINSNLITLRRKIENRACNLNGLLTVCLLIMRKMYTDVDLVSTMYPV